VNEKLNESELKGREIKFFAISGRHTTNGMHGVWGGDGLGRTPPLLAVSKKRWRFLFYLWWASYPKSF
jgi:hypothetical protein